MDNLLLTFDEIMDIEESVEDAVFSGKATDVKGVAIAKAQLAKDRKYYEWKINELKED